MIRPEPKALQELVRDLHQRRSPWLPAGLCTRLEWGPAVRQPFEVVSCAALDRIVAHQSGDFTVTVQVGTPLLELQDVLGRHRQWLSVDLPWGCRSSDPASGGSVGGLVARGLAAGYRQRYLGVRDQLLGLALLRVDGVEARAGGRVVKNVAGYDLMRLFTGSWGSLGLITEVTLRTMPLPPWRRGLIVAGPLSRLAALAGWLLNSSLVPERIDWWSGALATVAGLGSQPLLLIALASVDRDTITDQAGTIAAQTDLPVRRIDADALGDLLAQARGEGAAGSISRGWLLRLGVSASDVETLLRDPALDGIPVDIAAESGLGIAWSGAPHGGTHGDPRGGNGSAPASHASPGASLSARQVLALRRRCRELGGHLTVLRQPVGSDLPAWEDAPARPLIERVKRQFDPDQLLAPGRLPGVARPLLN